MKHYHTYFWVLGLLFVGLNAKSQNPERLCEQTSALIEVLQSEHITPKPVDDAFSEAVFDLFIDSLDPYKRFLTKTDSLELVGDRTQIDNYIQAGDCSFTSDYATILYERIANVRDYVSTLHDISLDYSGSDTLYFNPNNHSIFLENTETVHRYWNKLIRFKTLTRLIENDSVIENTKKKFKKLEKSVKQEVIDNELCILDRLFDRKEAFNTSVDEKFLNAITAYHDPNSVFFNISAKTSYENDLTTNALSFGFYTQLNDNNDVVVMDIVPGSSAYKNGELEVEDIILSMRSGKDELDTSCIDQITFERFTSDPGHAEITFKIKKKSGKIATVSLRKSTDGERINVVNSYVLQHEQPIGYLQFDSFYTDFESPNGLGVANDVAKELLLLKRAKIEALVIDLRNNGGGSLGEAIDLCGMFINFGPIAILSEETGDTQLLGDTRKGSLFNKPILVLVNGFSASASELFAGVMQDYNRAIIAGSLTYGKSSSQRIVPLDEQETLGYAKVTMNRFYRVTGESVQSKGIVPDIVLPDMYDGFNQSEKYLPFHLDNTSISVSRPHKPLPTINIQKLLKGSQQRVSAHTLFKSIDEINNKWRSKVLLPNYKYPLTFDGVYGDEIDTMEVWNNFIERSENYTAKIEIQNTKSKERLLQYDPEKLETNIQIRQDLAKDPAIEEAYNILRDYLNTLND